jgi:hypothetical protein
VRTVYVCVDWSAEAVACLVRGEGSRYGSQGQEAGNEVFCVRHEGYCSQVMGLALVSDLSTLTIW